MNSLAIIILNWNGFNDTIACLDSLKTQKKKDFTIILIDNGSLDASVGILTAYKKNNPNLSIKIIKNKKNLGFAGGVNTGIRWAMKNNFKDIVLFNNDAIADKEWLINLYTTAQRIPEAMAITGLLLHERGETIDSSGDFYSDWGLPFPRSRNEDTKKAPTSGFVFSASGGATLYRAALFEKIGLFDEDFFAYYEDVDLSFRAQLAGCPIYYTNSAIAYHKQGASSKKIPGFTVFQTFKNLPLLFIKNVPRKLLFSVGKKFYLAYILMFLNALKRGYIKQPFMGLFWSIKLTPKKLIERKNIQRKKTTSNEMLWSKLWHDLPPDQTGIRKIRSFFLRNRKYRDDKKTHRN